MDRSVTPVSRRDSHDSGQLGVVLPGGVILASGRDSPIEVLSTQVGEVSPLVSGPTAPPVTSEGQTPPPIYQPSKRPTWLPSDPWKTLADLESDTTPAPGKSDQHWKRCRELIKKFDSTTMNGWKDEIQTQLLVASLLAAMTAVFAVETQKQLSDDPLNAPTVLLAFIASQLNGSTGGQVPAIAQSLARQPTPTARAINALLLSSLGLSLANITLGLLCLQWIRELKLEPPGILSKDYHHFRCVREDGFQKWGAKRIILALPLLLLSALTTFFAGLLCYISSLDWIVALPLYIILSSILIILVYTTILPAIILLRDSGFHPGGEAKFSPLPPFRSVQSWLFLQGGASIVQGIAKISKISLFNTFSALRHCPDWGRVDQLWVRWSTSLKEPSLILPLVLSTSNNDDMKNIVRCYEEANPGIPLCPTPAGRRLEVLRYFVGYGTALPPNTLGQLMTRLIEHFASMVNNGCAIEELGSFKVEGSMNLFSVETSEPIFQLMNAVLHICKVQIPTEEVFWDLFWNTITRAMADFENSMGTGAPAMIKEAFDTYGRALENPEIAEFSPRLIGLRHFLFSLHREVNIYPYWSSSELGAQIGHAILCHPVWEKIHASAFAIPSDPATEEFRSHLVFLANFKKKRNLVHVLPSSDPGIVNVVQIQQGPPSNPTSPQRIGYAPPQIVELDTGTMGVPAQRLVVRDTLPLPFSTPTHTSFPSTTAGVGSVNAGLEGSITPKPTVSDPPAVTEPKP